METFFLQYLLSPLAIIFIGKYLDYKIESHQKKRAEEKAIEYSGVLLELPVWFDMEDADGYKANNGFAFDPNEITAMCRAFLDNIQLNCGVYASYSWLTTYIDWQSLGCAVWNAEWGPGDDIKGMMWQYTDNQHIPGAGYFDANYIYES